MELTNPIALIILGVFLCVIGQHSRDTLDTAPPRPPRPKERGPGRKLSAVVLSLIYLAGLLSTAIATQRGAAQDTLIPHESIKIIPTIFADIKLDVGVPTFTVGFQAILDSPSITQRRTTLLIPQRPGINEDTTSYLKEIAVVRSAIIRNDKELNRRHTMNLDLGLTPGLPLSCRGIGIEFHTTAPGRVIVNVQFDREHLAKLEKDGIKILYLLLESEMLAGDDRAHSITAWPVAVKSISKLVPEIPGPEPVPSKPRPTPKPPEKPKPHKLPWDVPWA